MSGGNKNIQTLLLQFHKNDPNQLPNDDIIGVTISSKNPYIKTVSFTITVVNASIMVNGNPTEWVGTDAILEVQPMQQNLKLIEYSFDNGQTWQIENQKVYGENINDINILARDSNLGAIGPVKVNITKIDKTPPRMWTDEPIENIIVTLNESKTLEISGIQVEDKESGLNSEGIVCYRGVTPINNTNFFNEVGKYLVEYKVSDMVGNTSSMNREVLVRWPLAGQYIIKKQRISKCG